MTSSTTKKKTRSNTAKARQKKREKNEVQPSKQTQDQDISTLEQAKPNIHSPQWTQWDLSTTPQKSLFVYLPLEIRLLIWELVILPFNNYHFLNPHRHKSHFISPGWTTASLDTQRISEICRQSYIDVVGGGLLYRFKTFAFSSPTQLRGYFPRIPGFCRDQLRTIYLHTPIKTPNLIPSTKKTFHMLSLLPSLKSLTLILEYPQDTIGVHQARPYEIDRGALPWNVEDFHFNQLRDCAELRGITGLREFQLRVFTSGWGFARVVDVFEEGDGSFGEESGGEVNGKEIEGEEMGDGDEGWWFTVEEDVRHDYSICTLVQRGYTGDGLRDPNPIGELRGRIKEVERVLRDVMCDM